MEKHIETLMFYTINDYLIINNLLLGNTQNLSKLISVVNNDYKNMIIEMADNPAKRLGLDDTQLANEIYEAYKKRCQKKLMKNLQLNERKKI
ncbi:MAG: hypothetical protein IJW25_00315 [Clostridia bacterium]|nr:hypothetical protein [Clostridia bacterium]